MLSRGGRGDGAMALAALAVIRCILCNIGNGTMHDKFMFDDLRRDILLTRI